MIRFRSFASAGFAVCFGLAAVFGSSGCGNSGGETTLGGNVKLDGAPVTAGMVKLVPQGGKDTAERNTIIDTGHYYFSSVPAGPVKISVTAPTRASGPNDTAPAALPAKYADPNQSGLTFTVKEGAKNTYDLDLTK